MPDGPSAKLTFDGNDSGRPFFAPDGRSVGYYTTQTPVRSLFAARTDGSAPPSCCSPVPANCGRARGRGTGGGSCTARGSAPGADLMAVRTDGDTTPVTLVATAYNERSPTLSPMAAGWRIPRTNPASMRSTCARFRRRRRPSARCPCTAHRAAMGSQRPGAVLPEHDRGHGGGRGHDPADLRGRVADRAVCRRPVCPDDTHRQYDVSPDGRRFLMLRQRGGERGAWCWWTTGFQELIAKVGR